MTKETVTKLPNTLKSPIEALEYTSNGIRSMIVKLTATGIAYDFNRQLEEYKFQLRLYEDAINILKNKM